MDHRKLGKELDLFSMNPDIDAGQVLWQPNGVMVRPLAEEDCKNEHFKLGYAMAYSVHIGRLV